MRFYSREVDTFDADSNSGATIECKYCGEAGLHWEDYDDRWELVNSHWETHHCNPVSGDEFTAI